MSARPKIQKKKSTLAQERDKALREGHITPIRPAAAPAEATPTATVPTQAPAPAAAPPDTPAPAPSALGEHQGDATAKPEPVKPKAAKRTRKKPTKPAEPPKATAGRGEPTVRMTLSVDPECVSAMDDLRYDELEATGVMPVMTKYYDRALAEFLPSIKDAAEVDFQGDPAKVYTTLCLSTRKKLRRIERAHTRSGTPVPTSRFYTEAVRRFIAARRAELELD